MRRVYRHRLREQPRQATSIGRS
jgi:Glutamine synthetase, catalytic domain